MLFSEWCLSESGKKILEFVSSFSWTFKVKPSFFLEKEEKTLLLSEEKTLMIYQVLPYPLRVLRQLIWMGFLGIGLGWFLYDNFLKKSDLIEGKHLFQPQLPVLENHNPQNEKSQKLFSQGVLWFCKGNRLAYEKASTFFYASVEADPHNIPALSFLVLSYVDLLGGSIKNEKSFFTIKKLLELIRAQSIDLPETVIADTEYYLFTHAHEVALSRIVEYTKTHVQFGSEMFFYTAKVFMEKSDWGQALQYAKMVPPENPLFAESLWLQGNVYASLQDFDKSLKAYQQSFAHNPDLIKSELGICSVLVAQKKWNEALQAVLALKKHFSGLFPQQIALAWVLTAKVYEAKQNISQALYAVEQASSLLPDHIEIELMNYRFRMLLAGENPLWQKTATMYYYLQQADEAIAKNDFQSALVNLLEALEINPSSVVPFLHLGDFFTQQGELENAQLHYKKATLLAKSSREKQKAWSSYLKSVLGTFDWENFNRIFQQYQQVFQGSISLSALNKLQGDFYSAQGLIKEAQIFYRKAMQADFLDDTIFVAIADNFMALKNYNDARFYYALALNFDPQNPVLFEKIAESIAGSHSIEMAIEFLNSEIKKNLSNKNRLLCALAGFYLQKGAIPEAQNCLDQVFLSDKTLAFAWKKQAELFLKSENVDLKVRKKALDAYDMAVHFNTSDVDSLIQRHHIFMRMGDFDAAKFELMKVYQLLPKYPNLHYLLGSLYYLQGNLREAVKEILLEEKNNPHSVQAKVMMGKILLEGNDFVHALEQFSAAIALDTNNVEARQNAGWVNYKLKNFTAAITLLQSAIERDLGNPFLYKRLAVIFRDMGDVTNACKNFREYIKMEPDATDKNAFDDLCK